MKKLNAKGFAHYVLLMALVVFVVIGSIGGYIMLKNSHADSLTASEQNARAGADKTRATVNCTTAIQASPLPFAGSTTTFKVKAKATKDVRLKMVIWYSASNPNVPTKHKDGPKVTLKKGKIQTIQATRTIPRWIVNFGTRYPATKVSLNLYDGHAVWCSTSYTIRQPH